MESVCEETMDGEEVVIPDDSLVEENPRGCRVDVANRTEECRSAPLREERSLSFGSQASVMSPASRSARTSRSRGILWGGS